MIQTDALNKNCVLRPGRVAGVNRFWIPVLCGVVVFRVFRDSSAGLRCCVMSGGIILAADVAQSRRRPSNSSRGSGSSSSGTRSDVPCSLCPCLLQSLCSLECNPRGPSNQSTARTPLRVGLSSREALRIMIFSEAP